MQGIKRFARSESGLILEALLGLIIIRWWMDFEIMVMGGLAVVLGHVVKMSWAEKRNT